MYSVLWIQGENTVTLPHSAQQKHAFWGGIKSKSEKLESRKKFALELLQNRLGHRSTRLLMAGDIAIFWKDIEPMIDPDPFCTPCQISSMNKKARSKNPPNPKAPFKWVFTGIIPATAPKRLTSETTFSNNLFIVDS